jgi:hypothetical protein
MPKPMPFAPPVTMATSVAAFCCEGFMMSPWDEKPVRSDARHSPSRAQTTFFAASIDLRSIEAARARTSSHCVFTAEKINRERRKSRLRGAFPETYDACNCQALPACVA